MQKEAMKVVLIDPHVPALKTIGDYLKDWDCEVLASKSVDEAIVPNDNGFAETDVVILNLDAAGKAGNNGDSKTDTEIRAIKAAEEQAVEILKKVHTRFPTADILLTSRGRLDVSSLLDNRVFEHFQTPPELSELETILGRIYEKRHIADGFAGAGR